MQGSTMSIHTKRRAVTNDMRGLLKLFDLVDVFRDLRPEMPIQMAAIFLGIALRPGITQAELATLVGIGQSSVSRNITAMSTVTRQGKPGLNLVVQRHDPIDGRAYEHHLTKDGRALADRLLTLGIA